MGAPAAPAVVTGETGPVELPLNVPAEQLGTRAQFVVRREDGHTSEFAFNLWELPQAASVEMDGRTWVRAQATLPMRIAARLSRCFRNGGRQACVHALHRNAGTGVYGSAPGTRRTRGGDRRQPVRRALGAQLGLRRFSRSAERDRVGGGGTGSEFRGAQSAACDPQPPAVQHQPLPAEQHLLPELPLPGCRGHGRLSTVPPGARAARVAGSGARDRGSARLAVCGI